VTAKAVVGYDGEVAVDTEDGVIRVAYAVDENAPVVVTSILEDKYYTLQCKATDHGTFIKDDGTSINGRSNEGSFFAFEAGTTAGTYYIKSVVSGKYINADGNTVTVDAEKKTAWVLGVPTHTADVVTFEDGTTDNFLNNNYTTGAPYLKANHHNGGPGSGNACSLWILTQYPGAKDENPVEETFVEPVEGKFYKIKGDNEAGMPWLTNQLNGNSIIVSANEADAAIFKKTTNGLKDVITGKFLGMNGSVVSLVDNEATITIGDYNDDNATGNGVKYSIKVGTNYMYNNNTDGKTHESSGWITTIERYWGFIEVDNPEVTTIDNPEIFQNSEIIYDLTGRRVMNIVRLKGIYIVNGKKVVVK
jgi:hypothetical protein